MMEVQFFVYDASITAPLVRVPIWYYHLKYWMTLVIVNILRKGPCTEFFFVTNKSNSATSPIQVVTDQRYPLYPYYQASQILANWGLCPAPVGFHWSCPDYSSEPTVHQWSAPNHSQRPICSLKEDCQARTQKQYFARGLVGVGIWQVVCGTRLGQLLT